MEIKQKYTPIAAPENTKIKDEAVYGTVSSIVYEDVVTEFKIFSIITDDN